MARLGIHGLPRVSDGHQAPSPGPQRTPNFPAFRGGLRGDQQVAASPQKSVVSGAQAWGLRSAERRMAWELRTVTQAPHLLCFVYNPFYFFERLGLQKISAK